MALLGQGLLRVGDELAYASALSGLPRLLSGAHAYIVGQVVLLVVEPVDHVHDSVDAPAQTQDDGDETAPVQNAAEGHDAIGDLDGQRRGTRAARTALHPGAAVIAG